MDRRNDMDDEESDRLLWPNIPRLCFGAGSDRRLDAEVKWVQSRKEFFGYIEGYRRAAATLFESLESGRQRPNYLMWPFAFVWRHHIELSLKDIIASGRVLNGEEWTFPTGVTVQRL